MANKTNFEHFRELEPRELANAIVNIAEEMCVCCPRERERRCNDDCVSGLLEWLNFQHSLNDLVWKVRRRRK